MQDLQKRICQKKIVCIIWVWIVILFLIGTHGIVSEAKTIYVGPEEQFTAIQPAIDSAVEGDVVIVKDGIYKGDKNKHIDFKGKSITLRSENGAGNTIIDCEQNGNGLYFHSGETGLTALDGFTIQNASQSGIYCSYSSPRITNCIISKNSAVSGGGIRCSGSSPAIINCIVTDNRASYGGGIFCSYSLPRITNCTISNNRAENIGGGIYCHLSSSPTVINSILWGDTVRGSPNEIHLSRSFITITHSDIQQVSGIYSGTGNINADPLFVNSGMGNYYLQTNSPCIDKGSSANIPLVDIEGIPRPQGTGIDMGANEHVGLASCTPRASFIADYTTLMDSLTVNFDASSSGGNQYPNAELSWDFGDSSIGGGLNVSHTYSHYGSYDVSLTITTACGIHMLRFNDLIKIGSLQLNKEVGEGHTYASIQEAINDAIDGEIILVHDGIYHENIHFKGKAITVCSKNGATVTFIDGNANGSVVNFDQGSDSESVLDGFTIQNGSSNNGGGIRCSGSSPTIINCVITNNRASWDGGGISCTNLYSPTIMNCTISNNSASHGGGGISCSESSPTIIDCTIIGNKAEYYGAGIYSNRSSLTITKCAILNNTVNYYGGGILCTLSSPRITNCIICNNRSNEYGGGIYCFSSSSPTINNCTISGNESINFGGGIYCSSSTAIASNSIFWGNTRSGNPDQIYITNNGSINIKYSNIQQESGIYEGTGNINADPLFVGSEQGNYYLQIGSPCIDTGTFTNAPSEDLEGMPRPQSMGMDMGAYEFVEPALCIPRGSFKADYTKGIDSLTVNFDASSSGGGKYPEARFSWNFGDGSIGGGINISHTYSQPGFYDVSLSITTECGTHSFKLNDLIKIKASLKVGEEMPYASIQDAIDNAVDGDIVLVHDGTYYENIDFKGKAITVRSKNGSNVTFIDGSSNGSVVQFDQSNDIKSVLDGLTIQNGSSTNGGGIFCSGSSPTIINCVITDNKASWDGGGIFCRNLSSPTIMNCTISNNSAYHGGGGISCSESSLTVASCLIERNFANSGGGISCVASSAKVTDCTISSNIAKSGGGFYSENSSSQYIIDCIINDNTANLYGGAIYCQTASLNLIKCDISSNTSISWSGGIHCKNSSLKILNCTIDNNSAESNGGGMSCIDFSSQALTNCIISNNRTNMNGGGIHCNVSTLMLSDCIINYNSANSENSRGGGVDFDNCESFNLDLSHCTIHDNLSTHGGGIHCYMSSPTMTNCLIYNNNAGGYGGGIESYDSSPMLSNCTIIKNISGDNTGGGIDVSGLLSGCQCLTPTVINCIIWNNSPREILSRISGSPAVTYSNIKGGFIGDGNINEGPLFFDPSNDDYRLRSDSPCIDMGTNTDNLYSDLRGSLRPIDNLEIDVNNNFDMGAFEYSGYNGDNVIRAFQEVKLLINYGHIGYDNQILWKSTGPFPDNDERISNPDGTKGPYRIRFALIGEDSERIDLSALDVPTTPENKTQDGYIWSHTLQFSTEHEGKWKVRIEMADDPHQFAETADWLEIKEPETETFTIGQKILLPLNADPVKEPYISDEDRYAFYWSDHAKELYAIAPIIAMIIWRDIYDSPIPLRVKAIWPRNPQPYIAGAPPVALLPPGSSYQHVERFYGNGNITASHQFTATEEGYHVLAHWEDLLKMSVPKFEVIYTFLWHNPAILDYAECAIGEKLTHTEHDPQCGSGYVYNKNARYDASIYNRDARTGPIIPVNTDNPNNPEDDLVILWYQRGITGTCWPFKPVHYECQWPQDADTLIIAHPHGTGDLPEDYTNITIYGQSDPNQPGYNPNEEHAFLIPGPPDRLYALRNDLNWSDTSEPYVLLKYQDALNNHEWAMKVHKLITEQAPYLLAYTAHTGKKIEMFDFIYIFKQCTQTQYDQALWWRDHTGSTWARRAGTGQMYLYYPLQKGFHYDTDKDGIPDSQQGQCIPWLDRRPGGTPGTPIPIPYTITWPEEVPELEVGQTLYEAQGGLPDINNHCSVEIIYDQSLQDQNTPSVKLLDPIIPIEADLEALPPGIRTQNQGNEEIFPDLPYYLRCRLNYDPLNKKLKFKGYYDDTRDGAPLLLSNVITNREKDYLHNLSSDTQYQRAVSDLYQKSQSQWSGKNKLIEGHKALTSGQGSGYITLAFGNEETCAPQPVTTSVISVTCPHYTGQVHIICPDNLFEDHVTLRHSGDFSGKPENCTFEWQHTSTINKPPTPDIYPGQWSVFTPDPPDGQGAMDITISGAGLATLTDRWVTCRYKGNPVCGEESFSQWTEPQLYEGWSKRLMLNITPYEKQCTDFHKKTGPITTFNSMIIHAGKRYQKDIVFPQDPNSPQSIGFIHLYETLFHQGSTLSIDAATPVDDPGINNLLLLAAGRISDLYLVLGNEAYSDALDPTIGFGTDHPEYGTQALTLHCFQDQTASLLEEQLALLRGRDSESGPNIDLPPLYNHLSWNDPSGQSSTALAYRLTYTIQDQNKDGIVDTEDARIMYPQGHGDAWGHYLTATKSYYRLLRHPHYTWTPRTEGVLVTEFSVDVDYYDERKFVRASAAKARCGGDILSRTYRKHYTEDPSGQWQGYKDQNKDRAWGGSQWAIRAAQGAYFDWIAGNALLPPEDKNHTGIRKVDRTSVSSLREIAAHARQIQTTLDTVDAGLHPFGIAKDALSFHPDPNRIDQGKTHFEQIYEKALLSLQNTAILFDHTNQESNLLRHHQDTLEDFCQNLEANEAHLTNRLKEIFGTPYPEDCGPSCTYPQDYNGPDIYHYMYIETPPTATQTFTIKIETHTVNDEGSLIKQTKEIPFHIRPDHASLTKPATWTKRHIKGKAQITLSELLHTIHRLEEALSSYNSLLEKIREQAETIEARYGIGRDALKILDEDRSRQQSLHRALKQARSRQIDLLTRLKAAKKITRAINKAISKQTGKTIGLSNATVSDWTDALANAIALGSPLANQIMNQTDKETLAELAHTQAKERVQNLSNIKLLTSRDDLREQICKLERLIRTEAAVRLELYTLQEAMQQYAQRYLLTLSEGKKLLDSGLTFQHLTAANIRDYRHTDMTFRPFYNDPLQKYHAQFDMAAHYIYQTAKAYNHETSLLDSHLLSGQPYLALIARQKTLGDTENNQGLAYTLAELSKNFTLRKEYLGFSIPREETKRFSLRKELFRIQSLEDSDTSWRQTLLSHLVEDLNQIPEFNQHCAPYTQEKQPGILIPFTTTLTPELNYFTWPLGSKDSQYSPSNFATRIRSVGIWFSGYQNLSLYNMKETPQIYLIPTGADTLRIQSEDALVIRHWLIMEQKIPPPFALGPSGDWSTSLTWIPTDTLSDTLGEISPHTPFLAYHDREYLEPAEMTFNSHLTGRSVWNTRWLLIILGESLHEDPNEGLALFINGPLIPGAGDERTGYGVSDIKIFFHTYGYLGN